MKKFLVCFTRNNDIQYHVFTGCDHYGEFVLDPLFRSFLDSGYTWSSVECTDQLFNAVLFTSSEVERGVF